MAHKHEGDLLDRRQPREQDHSMLDAQVLQAPRWCSLESDNRVSTHTSMIVGAFGSAAG